MNPSVHLVEAAVGYLEQRDFDAYLALLSPDVRIGVANHLPQPLDEAALRQLLADDQVLKHWVDEVVLGTTVRVTVEEKLHRPPLHPAKVQSVYWVRGGRIVRLQLGRLVVAGQVWVTQLRLRDLFRR